jgi:hypothetical protein
MKEKESEKKQQRPVFTIRVKSSVQGPKASLMQGCKK